MAHPDLKRSLAPGGAHHLLSLLQGRWRGSARTWFEPGVLADTSPFAGEARLLLGGRFVHLEYTGAIQGDALQGLMLLGFDLGAREWTLSWIDTFHDGTATMTSRGAGDPFQPGPCEVLGSYRDPSGGPDWGWKTRVEVPSPDRLEIRHWNVPPGGEPALAVEILCARDEGAEG